MPNGNQNSHTNPQFTVDSVLFTVADGTLKVLLVKRANQPFEGLWGLPGGFIDQDLDLNTDDTAKRKLKEKTSVEPQYLEQLQVFSGDKRDPRGYSITLVYYALVTEQKVSTHISTVDDVAWFDVNALAEITLAFDHFALIQTARQRLQQKALYSMVPVYCMPERFTIGQLKSVIETIIEKPIQRKSLIRRIEASEMFEGIEEKVRSGGRLAQLYKVKSGVDIAHFERNFSV
ncbi:NUDIX hydrolase [Grimontia kaedaensis]|uniref:NUDIX hydrolase n=1 Tax=Grimontia kaedaensis TaxID=2872157 RepID=A0ABY4WZD8_9GAMM|nr:NUDIX domain-containing protein [Grimontia kaedaensis]USH04357.1 NUDIX hydrolase [Grimontia kaedaensis]